MTSKKSTKRSLVLSALSLLLCVSMLIGSTFAWFTDSVTSSDNKIQAGTLDIQLLMKTAADGDYVDISNKTAPIFGAGSIAQDNNAETLWDPGKTQVAYLAIKNNGNLALKYTVGLDVENVSKELYEVMQYTITPDAQYGTVNAWAGNGNNVVVGTQSVSETVSLGVGETHYFALSIHMDEAAGNEYQGGAVNFDLTVLATQDAVESDSFDNQYDAAAEMPGGAATSEEKKALLERILDAEDGETIYLDALNYGEYGIGAGHNQSELPENLTIVGDPSARIDLTISNNYAVKGWIFKNVTFTGGGFFITNDADAQGVTLDGCVFETGADLYFKKASGDVTIQNSTFYGNVASKGLYIQDATNVTVDRCIFYNNSNAVNISASGNVIISNNVVNVTTDRPLRFVSTAASTIIKVTGNTIVSDGDSDGELMKVSGDIVSASAITLSGNTWNSKTDSEVTVGMVDGAFIVK